MQRISLSLRYVILSILTFILSINLYSLENRSTNNSTTIYQEVKPVINYIKKDLYLLQKELDAFSISFSFSKYENTPTNYISYSQSFEPGEMDTDKDEFVSFLISCDKISNRIKNSLTMLEKRPLKYISLMPTILPFNKGNINIYLDQKMTVTLYPTGNTDVIASHNGTVISVNKEEDNKYSIAIMSSLGFKTLYKELSSVRVREGDKVSKYTVLAKQQISPIKYEVYLGNKKINPYPFFLLNSAFELEKTLNDLYYSISPEKTLINKRNSNIDYNIDAKYSSIIKTFANLLVRLKGDINIKENLCTTINFNFYNSSSDLLKSFLRFDFIIKLLYQNLLNVRTYFAQSKQVIDKIPNCFPITGGGYSRGFRSGHLGIDLYHKAGIPVYASADGVVTASGYHAQKGNHVEIMHDNGFKTKYFHFTENLVTEGMQVKRGYQIGTVGRTGRATGNHLHYEVLLNNKAINPLYFLVIYRLYR